MTGATSQPAVDMQFESDADRAAARGDLAAARALLEQATRNGPPRLQPWLKLSAICRGLGDLDGALAAVDGGLTVEPLGFMPLLLKANLLEARGNTDEAGEIYGYALAQQPAEVPPQLRDMADRARRFHSDFIDGKDRRLAAAQATISLDAREAARVDRFRTNIVRKTRPFHAEPTHFHYPGLREREFHDRQDFEWISRLEAATQAVIEDFHRVTAAERSELVPYIQYPHNVPLRQWATLNHNRAWTAIHLIQNGRVIEANARHCPAIMNLLPGLDQPTIPGRGPNAMFSLLAPGAHIPPHNGVANTRLVCHLPLIVPPGCWFRVGDSRREWTAGEAWVFDDTIEHEAMNGGGALRVILIVDTWHPDLSPAERGAIGAVMAATDPPGAAESR